MVKKILNFVIISNVYSNGDKMDRAHVSIPRELANIIDEKIVGKLGYKNRTEVVREMVRRQLSKYIEGCKKSETKIVYFPRCNLPYRPGSRDDPEDLGLL